MATTIINTKITTPTEIHDAVREVFDESETDLWLRTPHPLLGGKTPEELAGKGDKQKQIVLDLLQAIKHGDFS